MLWFLVLNSITSLLKRSHILNPIMGGNFNDPDRRMQERSRGSTWTPEAAYVPLTSHFLPAQKNHKIAQTTTLVDLL